MIDGYDVIIVGAGPAGLSCAIELQKSEMTVLLLEKNNEIGPKVCAGGLTTKIEGLNISLDAAEILFSEVTASLKEKSVKISNNSVPFVGTIDRGKLGKFLANKLSSKTTVKTCCNVTEIGTNFVVADGKKISFKYLVGADGSNSLVRKSLGLKNNKFLMAIQYFIPKNLKNMEYHVDTSLFGSGYSWIFPHKGYTSVGCCQDTRSFRPSTLQKALHQWLADKQIDVQGSKLQGWTINFDYQGFEFGNKFLIGDAGGFASGLTGEGIYFGLVSGRDVARRIKNPKYRCKGIAEILRIKCRHERVLSAANFLTKANNRFANALLSFFVDLGKYSWFQKKLIKNFG